MLMSCMRSSRPLRVIALISALLFARLSLAQTIDNQGEIVYQRFQEVINLRGEGEYSAAVAKLRDIMEEYSQGEQILRTAYNYLVSVYLAEEITFPPRVNELYNRLRKEMFGSLTIKQPKDCRVQLNDKQVGTTPLQLDLVRVGTYALTISKSGYEDYVEQITVEPDRALDMQVSLDRKRGWGWWTTRIGVGALAVTLLAVGLNSGGDGGTTGAPDLPEPPAPPAN
jgi:hypothetical protein